MRPTLLGARLPRLEDDRLLTGRGTFVADLSPPGLVDVAFVRSPFAHATVRRVDVEAARAVPGVVEVISAKDITDVSPFPDFFEKAKPVRGLPLCGDRVRYTGAPVAAVAAMSRYVAEDASELVEV